ncbi:MAG: adenylyltransferase/cytidyltransferase family protein [Bacteroidales bacterium]|nr:adenylyltransferase/cytidyltransferase family protein [Bacteroidales bacterium]
MKKVITYGTYDMFHYGHLRLLERAKALGDYLIVGVTADSFDLNRGKINVQQSLMERIEAVRATGIADEIIIEEYEGQKIDDIKRYGIDIFTVGSDWKGKFDYLNEFCKVVYLDRTEGVSSSEIRAEQHELKMGLVGDAAFLNKFYRESKYVNGIDVVGVCSQNISSLSKEVIDAIPVVDELDNLISNCDALYFITSPVIRYESVKKALNLGKHVLCESPICVSVAEWKELKTIAQKNNCVLMDAIRTAYSTAFSRLLVLVKSGRIGEVVSVDATCTSLRNVGIEGNDDLDRGWNSLSTWGPAALLPIFYLLGTTYCQKTISSRLESVHYDSFTKVAFTFPHAVASIKVGQGVKSEGELVISGTKGYVYVPAPWWKTDYFELRYENSSDNKRYFYQLDGEGIRNELVVFLKSVLLRRNAQGIDDEISQAIVKVMEDFYNSKDLIRI